MNKSTLSLLDSSLYPQVWEQEIFNNPQDLLMAMLIGEVTPDSNEFTKRLLANEVYQDWINATVFGCYIQRYFAAFYRQTEDGFNVDMPELFRHELMRHTQYLPIEQVLFVAGKLPKSARQEKLFTTTLNPATAAIAAQQINKSSVLNKQEIIINQVRVMSKQVLGFPIRHNKRTSERTRNEVLILDFNTLRLSDEQIVNNEMINQKIDDNVENKYTALSNDNAGTNIVVRFYELR